MDQINSIYHLYAQEATDLLRQLIATPSFSKEEQATAGLIEEQLQAHAIITHRQGNNVWCFSRYQHPERPTILLNSHHDTVRPVQGWTKDPFQAEVVEKHLYGLGSNDAGAALCCLMMCFIHFYDQPDLPFNLIFAATAEEEISGANGIASILDQLGKMDVAIVGEPTQMRMAIAEKGLMVIDAVAQGRAGHAAREEGVNALYIALEDIQKIRHFQFDKNSELLGPVKMSVTQIAAGTQHNVVPDACQFVIDVRSNECYSNEKIFELLQATTQSQLKARSFRLSSSGIPLTHPLVEAGLEIGLEYYGSPTLSDQALLPLPSLKIGPGQSARSHTANEFILLNEIEQGIDIYIQLLEKLTHLLSLSSNHFTV